jgi:hypothetical protein
MFVYGCKSNRMVDCFWLQALTTRVGFAGSPPPVASRGARPCTSNSGQIDARCFGIAAEQHGNVADLLHEHRVGRRANRRDPGFARFAILGVDPDLDQFVTGEGARDFLQARRRHATFADDDNWLTMMAQGLEMTLLGWAKIGQEGRPVMAKENHSVTGGRGFGVAASPLNEVKLDLAIILVVGALLLLVQGRIVDGLWVQLLLLSSYGLLGTLWIIVRARRVVARLTQARQPGANDGSH